MRRKEANVEQDFVWPISDHDNLKPDGQLSQVEASNEHGGVMTKTLLLYYWYHCMSNHGNGPCIHQPVARCWDDGTRRMHQTIIDVRWGVTWNGDRCCHAETRRQKANNRNKDSNGRKPMDATPTEIPIHTHMHFLPCRFLLHRCQPMEIIMAIRRSLARSLASFHSAHGKEARPSEYSSQTHDPNDWLINLMTTMAMTMMQSTRVTPCHKVNINRTIILDMINIDSCRCRWFEQILQWRRQLPDFRLQASETSHQWMSSTQGYWNWQDLSMRSEAGVTSGRQSKVTSKQASKQATMANHKVHRRNEQASKQASSTHLL